MTPQWAWATHQPFLQSALDLYGPKYILEIGIGNYSTPIFSDRDYKGIEQDEKWLNIVKEKFPELDLVYHEVPLNSHFRYVNLNYNQRVDIINYYFSLRREIEGKEGPKLLFVDCFLATRMYALNTLWNLFDVVIFHDSHPRARSLYGYDKLKITYPTYKLTSKYSWTDMAVKNDVGFTALRKSTEKYIRMFEERWEVNSGMKVIR